jgi:glycerol-3-phosphate dehydrogenase subunit C
MTLPERRPRNPPAYDPNEPRYWDERDLEEEVRRTFHICADCRMCVTYCGSFPILFDAVDREVELKGTDGVEALGTGELETVSDHCWQCKLCYIKCPYTPDEGAYEALDFPRLMAREKAQRARRDGVPLVDQILGEPRLVGAAGSGPQAKLANLVNANRLVRKVAEKVTGISAEFELPPLAAEPFMHWFEEHRALDTAGTAGEVVLFATCYGEYNFSNVPKAAVLVLEKNGYTVHCPPDQECCGMPNLDGGDLKRATAKMQCNVDLLLPLVRRGLKIVVPGPTCGYTMKKEWPVYLGTEEAAEVAAATLDLMEFLDALRRNKALNQDFGEGLGKVAYHAACHLRAQKIAMPGARVLSRIPDTEVRIVERCSAVDGTWGMKAKYYEEGARYAQRLVSEIDEQDGPETIVGDCSLAGLRVKKALGKSMLHPAEALAAAYGLDLNES